MICATEAFSQQRFEGNWRALRLRSPQLAEQLRHIPEDRQVQVLSAASGDPTAFLRNRELLLHSAVDPVTEAETAVTHLLRNNPPPLLCLGVGLGYYLETLLKLGNPCQPVIAYERNLWLLRLALMRSDFSRDILAGRVRFLSETELADFYRQGGESVFLWLHPVLGDLYGWERQLPGAKRPSRQIATKALVVCGGLFTVDVTEALQESGISVRSWELEQTHAQEADRLLREFAPELVVAINYRHGLPEICESRGIPLIIWEIDPSIERLAAPPKSTSHTHFYTYRKSHVARYRAAGFKHVEYLPLAANPRRRFPKPLSRDEKAKYLADVSFVGSSMAPQAQALSELYTRLTLNIPSSASAAMCPPGDFAALWRTALHRQEQNTDRYVIEEVFREHLGDAGWVVPDTTGRLVDLTLCAAEAAAVKRRTRVLAALANGGRARTVKVWGDASWTNQLPEEICYCGPAGHYHELTTIYNASRINLDINRIYQRDITTMRVFDVLACKGFLLADYSDDLRHLFQVGQEVIAYRSVDEIPGLVDHFLANPGEREQVAAAGHQKVLQEHTIQKRLQIMLDNLP